MYLVPSSPKYLKEPHRILESLSCVVGPDAFAPLQVIRKTRGPTLQGEVTVTGLPVPKP